MVCRKLEMLPDRVRRAWVPRRVGLAGLPGDAARSAGTRCPTGSSSRRGFRARSSRPPRRRGRARRERLRSRGRGSSAAPSGTPRAKAASLELYRFASAHAEARGIILADTKFELGVAPDGSVVLGDEALTPDSSRFWPADGYEPGRPQPSFDKQFVRDWCERTGWDKTLAGARAPGRRRRRNASPLRRGVRAAHRDLLRGVPRATGGRAVKASVLVRPKAGHPRPAGRRRRALATKARLRRLDRPRRSRDRPRGGRGRGRRGPRPRSRGCATSCSRTRSSRASRSDSRTS